MKKSTRIRPVVESLESMMLLSTAVAHLHPLAQPVAHIVTAEATKAVAPVTVALHGTIKGTGKINGTSAALSGSGNLGSVGATTFKVNANLLNPPTSITLASKKGNLYLTSASPLVGAGTSGSTTYTITGGTKAYAHATGSGSVVGTYSLLKGNKLAVMIRFS